MNEPIVKYEISAVWPPTSPPEIIALVGEEQPGLFVLAFVKVPKLVALPVEATVI
jgi:hypothetical protein